MSLGEYLVGLAAFATMLGGVAWGSLVLLRARLGHLRGAERVIAMGVLVTLGVLAVHLVPLALGVLSRVTVLVATAAWVLAARAIPAAEATPDGEPEPPPPERRAARILAWVAVALAGMIFLAVLGNQLTEATDRADALNFHLPGVGAWMQSGSLWHIAVYLPEVSPGHYPNSGDVILLATILPWKADFLAHLAMYPYLLLSGVAGYSLARELGAPQSAAVMSGCLLTVIPSVSAVALRGGLVDTVMVFTFAAGLLFLLRHHRTGRGSDLALAGLALGIAFGTKWYAVSSVPIVVAVWLAARLAARCGVRRVLGEAAQLTGLVLLAGGIWLVRNLVESSNPFFPVKVELLGLTLFDAPPDRIRSRAGFTILDYVGDGAVWRDHILPQYRYALAAPVVLAAAGLVLAAIDLLRTRRRRASVPHWGTVGAAVVCGLLLALAYAATPYSAGGTEGVPFLVAADARYVIPAVVVALPLLGWLASRHARAPMVVGVVGLLAVVNGLHQTRNALERDFPANEVGHVVLVVLVLLGLAAASMRVLAPLQGAAKRRALLGGGAALCAAVAVSGYEVQRVYMDKRYAGIAPVFDAILEDSGGKRRVGIAGLWPFSSLGAPLIAFGPRYENEVAYIGRWDGELLRRYGDERSFAAALRRGRYDLVLIGRGIMPRPRVREQVWARRHGYRQVVHGNAFTLLAAPGVELAGG